MYHHCKTKMEPSITFILVVLLRFTPAFGVHSSQVMFDLFIEKALDYVDNEAKIVNASVNNVRNMLNSLENPSLDGMVNIYFAEYFDNLESIYNISKGMNEEICFNELLLQETRYNVEKEAKMVFTSCVSRFTKPSYEEVRLRYVVRSLDLIKEKLKSCKNSTYRRDLQSEGNCVINAKYLLALYLDARKLSSGRQVYVRELSKCITKTISKGEEILKAINILVSHCLNSISDKNEVLQSLKDRLLSPGQTKNFSLEESLIPIRGDLKNLTEKVQTSLTEIKFIVNKAADVEYSVFQNISSNFNQARSKLDQKISKFGSNKASMKCAENLNYFIRNFHREKLSWLASCNRFVPDLNLLKAREIAFLNYNNIVLNCIANITNIFATGRLKICIDGNTYNDVMLLSQLIPNLENLKTESEQFLRSFTECADHIAKEFEISLFQTVNHGIDICTRPLINHFIPIFK